MQGFELREFLRPFGSKRQSRAHRMITKIGPPAPELRKFLKERGCPQTFFAAKTRGCKRNLTNLNPEEGRFCSKRRFGQTKCYKTQMRLVTLGIFASCFFKKKNDERKCPY